jgi:hypothetical protein
MWNGWVDDLKPQTYIVGHWNYDKDFVVPEVYVVSNADNVVLRQNGMTIKADSHQYRFLWTFKNVKYEADKLEAIAYDKNGREVSRDEKVTAGEPAMLKLTTIENPTGWKADGADVALVQVEVVDKDGRRCPLDNRLVKWTVKGPVEYRGGIAKTKPFSLATNPAAPVLKGEKIGHDNPLGIDAKTYAHLNHVLQDTLPVECGVNRVILRSLPNAGKITVTAQAKGLPKATVELHTQTVSVAGGLTTYKPADGLQPRLGKGETPLTPSFTPKRREVAVIDAEAGCGDPTLSFDTYENTIWESEGKLDKAWITYTLAEPTVIDEVCVKMKNFRSMSYPVDIYADSTLVWSGNTPKGLGFGHLRLKNCPKAQRYTLRMRGVSKKGDLFAQVKELDSANDEKESAAGTSLKIVEIEFLRDLK